MQSDQQVQIEPDQSIGQQIDRMDRTIQNQQFLIQSLIKSLLKNSTSISQESAFKKELNQMNQRYEDMNEQIILETHTFSAYDTAFSQIQNRLNKIESQLNKVDQNEEETMAEAEKDLIIDNMKVDIECLKEQFTNLTGSSENYSSKNTVSIIKTAFMSKFDKMKNYMKSYQDSTNKAISDLRKDLENLEMSGQEYHQEFTRLNAKVQNFQIALNYLKDQMNIPDEQGLSNVRNSQLSTEIESINKSIESIQQKCVLREDAQDYENKVNSIKEKLAQFPLIAAQQEKCKRDIFNLQGELTQLKNCQYNSSVAVSADYQSKLNSISESQQKTDETLRKTRKVVSNLKSELEQLKQSQNEKVVTRDIQINDTDDQNSKVDGMWTKVKSNLEKQNRKFKQNEAQINKINEDISSIQESLSNLNRRERSTSHNSNSNTNDDYSTLAREIKKLKNEVKSIKENSSMPNDENQEVNDSIIQRINQISSQQKVLISQYNGLISQTNEIRNELNDLSSKVEENEEKNNSDIELINKKVKNLSENINEEPGNPVIKERSIPLIADDMNDEEDASSLQQLSKAVKIIESNLNALRIRTESGISNQNKLVIQFNELVPQLRQLKDQLIDHIIQSQQNSIFNKSRNLQNEDEDGIEVDDNENASLRSIVSNLQSKVDRIEKGLGTGEEFHPFLNQVRTEVNSLEKEIATVKSNSPEVSTSAFKTQSNQITKLQRQVHNLKRNFEKHLILSSNTNPSQEGIQLDDDEDDESESSLSNLINANATAGTKMKDSILDAIEKRVNEMKSENDANNSNIGRKVEELEKKVKKMMTNKNSNNLNSSAYDDDDLSERVNRISSVLNENVEKVNQLYKEMGNVSTRQVNLNSPSKRSVSSPKGDFDNANIDKKLSQLYVQVNSCHSGMSNLSNSVKDLAKKCDQLRNDVNSLMPKSPSSNKRKLNGRSKFEKSNNDLSDIDYNDNENSEDF